jgi:formylglycine-generating enzyme required for sulfatase activity
MTDAQDKNFVERFEDHATEMKMVRIPDGEVEVNGVKKQIKNLYFQETEMPWQIYEIWALRLDQTEEDQTKGVDAVSRPSKPYAVIFTGFGHHGFPVNCVSHNAATEFCKWLSTKTGKKYRLPTDWEWQYAAYAAPSKPAPIDQTAWYWDNADDLTHPCAKKAANLWGLYDMLGNVAEWANTEEKAVVCGGSWKDKAPNIGGGYKLPEDPAWNMNDPQNPKSKWWLANGQFIGFRVVCEGPIK